MSDAAQAPVARPFATFSIDELKSHSENIVADIASNRAILAQIQSELAERFGAQLAANLAAKQKDTGTARVDLADGYSVERETKKEVSWDSALLLAAATNMPWDQFRQLFKIELSVPEKIYGGLAANPELKAKIDAARTVTLKPGTIVLKKAVPS